MVKQHIKRLNAPRSWPISRKGTKWVTRQNPGAHSLENSVPLNIMLKDMLKYAKTTRDVKRILNNKEILIDNIPRTDIKFSVGIFDLIEIPKTKEHFLLLLNKKGKLFPKKIDEKKAELKHIKIIGKTVLKKGKFQVNFNNGNNMIMNKKDYNIGDTLIINLKDKKIVKHIKLQKGVMVYLTKGKHVGETGSLENIPKLENTKNNLVELKINDKIVNTLKDYIFVVDKDLI